MFSVAPGWAVWLNWLAELTKGRGKRKKEEEGEGGREGKRREKEEGGRGRKEEKRGREEEVGTLRVSVVVSLTCAL